MELQDYVGVGYDVLMVVCNQLLVLVVENLELICVCYNGFDDSLQLQIDIDQCKVQVLGVVIDDINDIL